jgi:Domain of unknown function (DUF4166)/Saccharopine dehydrogenase NADP binding domain
MKVLILGGYGVFGGRLAVLLSDLPSIEMLICGRDLGRAEAFCRENERHARLRPAVLDRRDIVDGLARYTPDLVVDASGPFQDYGADRYRVIEACIDARVDYLDFSDAADFVFGVARFDDRAKAAGVFVLSGVSSFPVLTSAVLREMAKSMEIVSVRGGIAPSPFAGIGLNVMRAVLGYAGAPVALWRGGREARGIGLAESLRYTIAVPGGMPLRNTHFSLVDVPDLRVIPPEHPAMTDIWMGAGPVPEVLHKTLNRLAKARARFGLPSWAPFAPLFYRVLNRMRFGEHRGGMFVHARGRTNGEPVERSWHLLAEADDGPMIPSMAIEAIVRKSLLGSRPSAGARPGSGALDLSDYADLFRGRAITMGFRDNETGAPLYRRLLGAAFATLPERVRAVHDGVGARRWAGVAAVRRGRGLLAKAIARLFGFPGASEHVPVSVTFSPRDEGEQWTRDFGGKVFSSIQTAGVGREQYLLVERFGPLSVAMALVVEGDRLSLIPRRMRLGFLPLPRCLLPNGTAFETQDSDRFRFDVEIAAPFVGLVVAYRGTLEPVAGW